MKSKVIALLSAAIFMSGCTLDLIGGKQKPDSVLNKPVAKKETIDNEFAFRGDSQKVIEALKAKGIEVEIVEVSAELMMYQGITKSAVSFETIKETLQPVVQYIEPNFLVESLSNKNVFEWPKDKGFFKQWAMNNIGQSPPYGLPGNVSADMDLMRAWEKTKGSKKSTGPVIAVIDTGVDYTHPDLKDNMWVNEKEAPNKGGVAGVDDDGNGYVDDVYGFDFVSSGRTKLWYGKPGDADPMDEDGHGTHCAGSIGAIANNDRGITGVNWEARVMAIRFLGPMGGSSVDAARAILYAAKMKVDVASNSWGGGGSSELIQDAIAEAQKAGVVFVAAAGNDAKNTDVDKNYPSGYTKDSQGNPIKNIITVGASDNLDNPASFSNYGHKTVDVFAPGVAILSLYPVALSGDTEPYAVMSGTSMATPYVAGVIGLMMAANPSLQKQPEKVKDILQRTVDVKQSLIGKAISNGRINAYKAVNETGDNPSLSSPWQTLSKVIDQRTYRTELVDIKQEIKVEGAKAIRVHFDFLQIDEPYDSVYLYDKNFRLVAQVEQNESRDFTSPVVPGDTMYVRYVNSLVQQINSSPFASDNEAQCLTRGALDAVEQPSGQFTCMIDKESNDDDGNDSSKPYTSFNSEGYSIDRIEYIASQAQPPVGGVR